jgi:hypothetical protein
MFLPLDARRQLETQLLCSANPKKQIPVWKRVVVTCEENS